MIDHIITANYSVCRKAYVMKLTRGKRSHIYGPGDGVFEVLHVLQCSTLIKVT